MRKNIVKELNMQVMILSTKEIDEMDHETTLETFGVLNKLKNGEITREQATTLLGKDTATETKAKPKKSTTKRRKKVKTTSKAKEPKDV